MRRPCSRGHVTALMADLPYSEIVPCIVHHCITDAVFTVFCKLHLPCVKNVMRRYFRVNFRGPGQLTSIIALLWSEVKFSICPSEVKKCMFRCVLERETRWCLIEWAIFLSSQVIREKWKISKLLSFLLWPDLEGSRYDLKRLTRVPVDWERPKDSFNLYLTALSQLGAKWHGGCSPPPPPCAF